MDGRNCSKNFCPFQFNITIAILGEGIKWVVGFFSKIRQEKQLAVSYVL